LDLTPTVANPESPQEGVGRGHLVFDHVSFTYPDAQEPALQDVSFSAGPGESTAIIGSTGSGKTTLLNLILRFYDVTEGRILIDGVDVRNYDQQTLRAKMGYVPQKSTLFSGTVAENLRWGAPTASDEALLDAARIAQAADFLAGREGGLESSLAQGGINLSGGQKQRISIARAVARRPEIYLFDDSFSALDFTTDARLRAALADSTRDACVLIVAQRVSTILRADRIVVLEAGKVAGVGTHTKLMLTCEVYREIVSSQLSEGEWEEWA
ncbi:MAG: ABC transporter ATP-binding protein, partial [Oscillospiraceae bacterium]